MKNFSATRRKYLQITHQANCLHTEYTIFIKSIIRSKQSNLKIGKMIGYFTKEAIWVSNNYMKRYSALRAFREMKIKITTSDHCTTIRLAKIKHVDITEY